MIIQRKWKISALAAMFVLALVPAASRAMDKIPDEYKINGFAAGCQAYSYSRGFTLFEAIKLTHEAGGKYRAFPRSSHQCRR